MDIPLSRRSLLAIPVLARAQSPIRGVDEEIRRLAGSAPLAMRFAGATARECREWQKSFAARLGELLGPFQPPAQWKTTVERTAEGADHVRRELVLEAEGERPLPVHLLLPKGRRGRRPGMLALHGHGRWGHDGVAGEVPPEARSHIEAVRYSYGVELARRGYAVAAPCFTPFGRRLPNGKEYGREDPCGVTFIRMMALGKVLMAENLRDALWSFALLAGHPEVDPERIGCAGLSYGGRMTMLTSALEPRIRVAVISGALNMIEERIRGRYSCGAQIIPGLLRYGDVPEIASLIAPRPCLWEVGNQDVLMVKDRIGPALDRMRRAWRALGAENNLQVDYFEGGHRWNGDKAYPLLQASLQP